MSEERFEILIDHEYPGFIQFREEGHRGMVRDDVAKPLRKALRTGDGVETFPSAGRGNVGRLTLDSGNAIIRRFRRGGLFGKVLPDWFFLVNRPKVEFKAHHAALKAGVPVPPLLGILWRYRLAWVQGAIATGEIEGAEHLQDHLRAPSPETVKVLADCGRAVRAMHDAGIVHGDLQIRNILVREGKVTLLDFDKAYTKRRVGTLRRARNLLRLRRSITKNGFHETFFLNILQGYGAIAIPWWLSACYSAKHGVSDLFRKGPA